MPTLSSITPNSKPVNSPDFVLTCNGTGFRVRIGPAGDPDFDEGRIIFDGVELATTISSTSLCYATVPASMLTVARTVYVYVTTDFHGDSALVPFTITPGTPTLTSISPGGLVVGASSQIDCTGTNFTATSVIRIDGAAVATTFISSTHLQTTAAVSYASGGNHTVTVQEMGVGESSGQTLAITNPEPAVTSCAPDHATVYDADMIVDVFGTGFVPSSSGMWNGHTRVTDFVSSTHLRFHLIGATDFAVAGQPVVMVSNAAPGGGQVGNGSVFTINNPLPTVTGVSPISVDAGSANITITVTGTGFVQGNIDTFAFPSQAKWNGQGVPTTVVTPTTLTFVATSSMLSLSGDFTVTVHNNGPGGGDSTTSAIVHVVNPGPRVDSLSPSSVPTNAGGASFIYVYINGRNFAQNAQAILGSGGDAVSMPTTYLSSGQLQVVVYAFRIPEAGLVPIHVDNPPPGGGSSNAVNLAVTNPAPTITALSASTANVGDAGETITITGTNFVAQSVATLDNNPRPTTVVSSTSITVTLFAADFGAAAVRSLGVTNPAPGGGSASTPFTVRNVVPTLTSIAPAFGVSGDPDTVITLVGTLFVAGTVAKLDGVALTTSFVSSTKLTAIVPAGNLAATGAHNITAFNPAPGGGASGAQVLTVGNPVPVIQSLTPDHVAAGSAALDVVITGTGFRNGVSSAYWNDSLRTTTFVSSTQIKITVTAADMTAAGVFPITVKNAAPGAATSNSVPFTVGTVNPVPTITTLTPGHVTQGSPTLDLAIVGTNFVAASVVRFEGSDRATVFVSPTQLHATITPTDLALPGSFRITVFNPLPGGGTSAAGTLIVDRLNPAPQITGIIPASVTVGAATFTLEVDGVDFVAGCVASTDSGPQATTFVSSTKITMSIPSTDVATTGTRHITVTNPAPGGGTSNTATLAVTAVPDRPIPAITSIAPATAHVNDAGQNVALVGTGFGAFSQVRFAGANRTTHFISSTSITVDLVAGDHLVAGHFEITVFNSGPGGGTSNAKIYSVIGPTNPAPTLTKISPDGELRGSPDLSLAVFGDGFVPVSQVKFGDDDVATTYQSPTRVDALIPAADVALGRGAVSRTRPDAHTDVETHNAQFVRAYAAGSVAAPAMTFGDSKTGWSKPEPGTAVLSIDGRERVRYDDNGVHYDELDVTGDVHVGGDLDVAGDTFERGRAIAAGVWDGPPHPNATTFTADSDATWFVPDASVSTYRYTMHADTMHLVAHLIDTHLDMAAIELYVQIPLALSAQHLGRGYVSAFVGPIVIGHDELGDPILGAGGIIPAYFETSGTVLTIRREDGNAWPATGEGSTLILISFTATFEATVPPIGGGGE
jgi:hypothetical protein